MKRNQLEGTQLIEREAPKWRKKRKESVTYEELSAVIKRTREINESYNDEIYPPELPQPELEKTPQAK